jgi:hypothetical protein
MTEKPEQEDKHGHQNRNVSNTQIVKEPNSHGRVSEKTSSRQFVNREVEDRGYQQKLKRAGDFEGGRSANPQVKSIT